MDQTASANAAAEIAALDPDTDYERIAFLLTNQMFPISIEKSLEYALFKTYAVPTISGLLARTKEFTERPQKRYDDTVLILSEIGEHGEGHPRAEAATARLNELHGRYKIRNEDYLYTLSTFVFEPIRFLDLYGPRPLTTIEQRGWLNAYRALGRRMEIRDIPETLEAFRAWREAFEAAELRPAPSNRVVADATMRVLFDMLRVPGFARPFAERFAVAVMEPHVAAAFDYAPAGTAMKALAASVLGARKLALRAMPARKSLRLQTKRRLPSYPAGYEIGALGPSH